MVLKEIVFLILGNIAEMHSVLENINELFKKVNFFAANNNRNLFTKNPKNKSETSMVFSTPVAVILVKSSLTLEKKSFSEQLSRQFNIYLEFFF